MPIMNMASNEYSINMCEPILYVKAIIYIAPDHVEISFTQHCNCIQIKGVHASIIRIKEETRVNDYKGIYNDRSK